MHISSHDVELICTVHSGGKVIVYTLEMQQYTILVIDMCIAIQRYIV